MFNLAAACFCFWVSGWALAAAYYKSADFTAPKIARRMLFLGLVNLAVAILNVWLFLEYPE